MKIFISKTTYFERSEKSVVSFIFGDHCAHSIEEGFFFLFCELSENRKFVFPKPFYDSDGFLDYILSVDYIISIK